MKKGNKSITEFFQRNKAIVNYLLVVGDSTSEQNQIDLILDGLLEEYNSFLMHMYGST